MFFLFAFQLFLVFASLCLSAQEDPACAPMPGLMRDLLTVEYWNRKIADRLPVTYNHLLQAGYFSMPSARMGEDGEIGLGYAYVPPYRIYNLRVQPLPQLEISGNYRVFRGVKDPVLSPFGFGEFADKGANFKFALFSAEDSNYHLPGVAVGLEDCIGTRSFYARYLVVTQVFLDLNLEVSIGYGTGRMRGFFGGFAWMPFRNLSPFWLKGFCLTAEYDSIPYKSYRHEPHPKGRKKNSPLNFGFKYRLYDYFDFSLAYIRGNVLACSLSGFYNLGSSTGFLPKIDDPLPYRPLKIIQESGLPVPGLANLIFLFDQQHLDILEIGVFLEEDVKTLRLTVLNETYWEEAEVRCRLNHLLGALVPSDISKVIVVIESEGFPIQEYHFQMDWVRQYHLDQMGEYELNLLTPMTEVSFPKPYTYTVVFKQPIGVFNFELSPKTHTLFGSAHGKFKYALGLNAAFNGFFGKDIFYNILLGCIFFTNLKHLNDFDLLNPSQLINVQTDLVHYYKQKGLTLDQAYLQKNWNLGKGFYARLAAGYFEEMYGGAASEFLFCPVISPWIEGWAIGVEGAVVKKRTYRGLGFTNKIRKLVGFIPTYRKFLGSQYFLNLYYDCAFAETSFKVSLGKFLANDWGVRTEMTRYFPSGLQLSFWCTWTNGHDRVNGKTYYDKGVAISMPLDIFYTYSERTRWRYGMSAWLRDVGAEAIAGMRLYEMISEQRQ